jgi:flagellar biogenesis protein FliO
MTSGKFSQETEIIEILSNYYLDPKKRIVVVRVGSSILVLGITNESINLITQLSDESEPTQIDDFSKLLQSEGSKPSPPSEKKADLQSSLREQIKHRVERLKPL